MTQKAVAPIPQPPGICRQPSGTVTDLQSWPHSPQLFTREMENLN